MSGRFKYVVWVVMLLSLVASSTAMAARIKDISSIKGVRENQLYGYGLVIGLNGTGDKGGSRFTVQALANMLENMGIHVDPADIKVKNVAAVVVSAEFPPFARAGKKIDVTLSSIGNAKSLLGGTLLLTPLKGVDGKVYALAQGPIVVGGYSAGGASIGAGVQKNQTTVGRISDGATIEREIPLSVIGQKEMTIILNNPDFNTATRAAEAINRQMGEGIANAIDSGTLKFKIPDALRNNVVKMIARIGNIEVEPDAVAKVIVNEKTGTVVVGENVRIQKVAVAHGNLSIHVKVNQQVSQPVGFAPSGRGGRPTQMKGGTIVAPGGSTVVSPDTDLSIAEQNSRLLLIPKGRTIGELVNALNAIGVTPRDLITILQTIKAAGALQGELEII